MMLELLLVFPVLLLVSFCSFRYLHIVTAIIVIAVIAVVIAMVIVFLSGVIEDSLFSYNLSPLMQLHAMVLPLLSLLGSPLFLLLL